MDELRHTTLNREIEKGIQSLVQDPSSGFYSAAHSQINDALKGLRAGNRRESSAVSSGSSLSQLAQGPTIPEAATRRSDRKGGRKEPSQLLDEMLGLGKSHKDSKAPELVSGGVQSNAKRKREEDTISEDNQQHPEIVATVSKTEPLQGKELTKSASHMDESERLPKRLKKDQQSPDRGKEEDTHPTRQEKLNNLHAKTAQMTSQQMPSVSPSPSSSSPSLSPSSSESESESESLSGSGSSSPPFSPFPSDSEDENDIDIIGVDDRKHPSRKGVKPGVWQGKRNKVSEAGGAQRKPLKQSAVSRDGEHSSSDSSDDGGGDDHHSQKRKTKSAHESEDESDQEEEKNTPRSQRKRRQKSISSRRRERLEEANRKTTKGRQRKLPKGDEESISLGRLAQEQAFSSRHRHARK